MSQVILSWALRYCARLEPIAAKHNGHCALTGGLLYKSGPRKDCDIVIYRNTSDVPVDKGALIAELKQERLIHAYSDHGRVVKAWTPKNVSVDFLFVNDGEEGEYDDSDKP